MKRITAIFFLVIFATSFTELGQLFKIPSLVQHYYSHQEKSSVSFFDYLEDHYSSHRDDGDRNEDMTWKILEGEGKGKWAIEVRE